MFNRMLGLIWVTVILAQLGDCDPGSSSSAAERWNN